MGDGLRFPAESDVIVHVEQIEPIANVLAFWGDLGVEVVEIGPALGIGRGALLAKRRPGGDFSVAPLGLRLGGDPGEDFTVAFSGGELFFQGGGVDPSEFQKTLIERAGVFVFADFAGEEGAALVEHAGKDDISSEAHAGAAGRAFRQIGSVDGHIF